MRFVYNNKIILWKEIHQGIGWQQVIRPTGLLDPKIDVRSTKGQIDDLLSEIRKEVKVQLQVYLAVVTIISR